MKFLFFSIFTLLQANANAQTDTIGTTKVVEAACGQCRFGLKGKGCDLAIRIDNKAYFVQGTGIDDHGDAHAQDGFCNAIRNAAVKGKITDGRFAATYFKLLPEPETKN